ncbi:FG-GAP repeat domain-containing protein [Aestuariirhabdus litorea]|uniref:VCBS repeat-containing protein n=1 Tax=Aestuariirhabdus litorea TaxID=2528527 RepID=A0A3P3VUL9_9GAMM|nr:VCBS repeat-containing protein [Aestuariirhabdus litorea]RRJ85139.1 VCBS repeat-containing protein [Aestuariirhabdus litorea]RWW98362.1 VCBS repeat-containing protein [Endozoicomonadaceae bacterium GTF-13]
MDISASPLPNPHSAADTQGLDPRSSLRYQILAHTFGVRIEAPLGLGKAEASSDPVAPRVNAVSASAQPVLERSSSRVINQSQSLQVSGQAESEVVVNDPLAIDLGGDGFSTTSVEQGIWFDINGDGHKELTSFVTGNDAFLALDLNNNGTIDSGRELFGDQLGARNGFEQAASLDSNGDGYLDAMDEQFHRLSLVTLGEDRQLQQQSLAQAGISRIGLAYRDTHQAINTYDSIRQLGTVDTVDGLRLDSADLMLGARSPAQEK